MATPLACVWWPHATAIDAPKTAAWLRHFSPYVEASADVPGLFFVDATGFEGLFVCQSSWAQTLWHACTHGEGLALGPLVHLHLGHHKVALWALVRAAEFARVPAAAGRFCVWPTPAQERSALSQVPLAALALPDKTMAAAQRLRLVHVRDVSALPLPSVQQHVGAPLAMWLRSLALPTAPLSRAVPLPPAVAQHELEWPTDDYVRLLFVCKPLVEALVKQAQARRQHVQSLQIVCRYEGRTPPPSFVRRLEVPEPGCDAEPWQSALRLLLEHAPWVTRVMAVALRAQLVWPKRPEQLVLWPDRPQHEREATVEALSKIRSAWGQEAVATAQLVPSHVPEDRFVWRAWQGEPLSLPTPSTARGADLQRRGRLPRVRIVWPVPRVLPPAGLALLRGDPSAQGGWWRGPYRINVGWWQKTPCDRDYVYLGRKDCASWLVYFDRQQRRWWWQGQVD